MRRSALFDHFRGNSSRISHLPTLPDGSGEGGLEMTQANQIKRSDDYKFVIVLRVEGHNSLQLLLRLFGAAVAVTTILFKLLLHASNTP